MDKASSPIQIATSLLALIAFCYMLRVGEYTVHTSTDYEMGSQTRTVQFTIKDVTFWKNGVVMKNWKKFHNADEATLRLTNQKNGKKNGTIHHEAITDKSGYCPIKALAYRIQHILSHGGDDASWLCDYWDGLQWRKVTAQNMTTAVKNATVDTKLYEQGITPKDVSSHSLRAGGAMALKLNGASDTTIKKAGRWTSMAFLQYIHNQIGHLSSGLSQTMKTKVPFRNVAGMSNWKPTST